MPTYYDSQNKPHILTKRLGSGGEGSVYFCEDNPQIVAKIYHEPVTPEKAGKLRWMASRQDENLNKFAAWVIDVLYDAPNGKIVGFLMPNVRAKEIHELYSLKSRRVYFPDATWHFLIHTAANLARAFYSLHKNEHVMGDINHGNCVVLADGTVKLIDCDSYSIKTERRRYSCELGVTTHLAPELQGANLRDIERQTNHDNFGLAVIIFQLLFLGRHPFAGNFLMGEDKPIEDCIRENLFAYGKDAKRKMVAQPPGTLSLSAVSPALENLFERAFTQIHNRPTPREWIEALEDLSDSLEQCSLNPGHLFYEKNPVCPWCEIESQTGLMLFPFVTTNSHLKAKHQKPFDIVTIENLIESFDIKPNLPVKLTENIAVASPPPSSVIARQYRSERNQKVFVCTTYFLILLIVYFYAGETGCSGCIVLLSIVVTCVLYNLYKDKDKALQTEESDRFYELEYKWNNLENEWAKIAVAPDLERDMIQIKEKLNAYRALQLDASEDSIQLSGDTEAERQDKSLAESGTEKYRALEQEISNLLASVRAQSVKLRGQRQNLLTQSRRIVRDLAQTGSNVKSLNSRVPIGLILVVITIGTPVITFSISALKDDPPLIREPVLPRPVTNSTLNVESNGDDTILNVVIPDEKITDKEIRALSEDERFKIANKIIFQSKKLLSAGEYEIAERRLKFALRFDNENTVALEALGNFFYDQKKYNQALKYFKQSNKIYANSDTNFLIGMTYLNMKNYAAARDIFLEQSTDGNQSSAGFYNLGMAYQGLGDHKAAIEAFQEALSLNRNDVDSIYQTGISFYKLGKNNEVRQYYQLLKEKDETRAKQFKLIIGKSVNLDVLPENSVESIQEFPLSPKIKSN